MTVAQFSSLSEDVLIRAAQHGDLNAFNEIILRYQQLLFGIAFSILGDEDVAADVVQESLISAFRKFNSFRGISLRSWLARVTINSCYDDIRRKRRTPSVPLELLNCEGEEVDADYWLVDPQADPEAQFDASQLDRAMQQALDQLPPIYRVVLVLVDIQGLSYEEAAHATALPIGTIKSRLARGRRQVRNTLQETSRELLPLCYQAELPLSV